MERYEAGMLAWSRAGHDKDHLYVICKVEGNFVYLTDGDLKPLNKPKKKKTIHIQVIREIPEELKDIADKNVKDEDIRRIIRRFAHV